VQDLAVAGEGGRAELARLLDHAGDLVVGGLHQPALDRLRHGLQQGEIAQALQAGRRRTAGVVPGLDEPVDRLEHRGTSPARARRPCRRSARRR
jgi:hypothetical protein